MLKPQKVSGTSVQRVPLKRTSVYPVNGPEIARTGQYPFVVLPGRAESDSRLFCLHTRLLMALQQAYGATFQDWTPPLFARDLARHFGCAPQTINKALRPLLSRGYIERRFVSNGRGPGTYQYKLVPPTPGTTGIGSMGG